MDVAGHAAGGVAMADAISENHACDVVAAREHGDKLPPVSAPEGRAITSLSSPTSSSERCALSFPAHSSMQPKGRAVVLTHSNCLGSILLNFMILWMSRIVFASIFVASAAPGIWLLK